MWYWHTNRLKRPGDRTDSPETDPGKCGNLIFHKSWHLTMGAKMDILQTGMGTIEQTFEKGEIRPIPHPTARINSK